MSISRMLKISEFCKTGSGGTPSRANPDFYTNGTIPWVKSGELRENLILNTSEKITVEAIQKSSAKIVPKGSLLLAMYGATVGRLAFLGVDAATNQAVCNIQADENIAYPKYFYYTLLNKVPEFLNMAAGGAQPNISQTLIRDTKIWLPPLEEQKRIAAILDKADALRRKRQQAIDLTDQLLRSVFLDMFGDPVTNPKGWNKGCLGDAVHFAKDGPHVSPKYSERGIPFLSTRHVKITGVVWDDLKYISTEEAAIQWKKCKPQYDDILYSKGGTTGIASHVDFHEEFAVWVHVALLRPDSSVINPVWLAAMLNSAYCYAQSQSYTHGATNKDLGLKRMIKIKMYIPPLEEQYKYAKFSKKLKAKINKHNEELQLLENLFSSLTQQAFQGELTKQTEAA